MGPQEPLSQLALNRLLANQRLSAEVNSLTEIAHADLRGLHFTHKDLDGTRIALGRLPVTGFDMNYSLKRGQHRVAQIPLGSG